jgi:glyoxylase-like metal-dependent hydrolase (beta-lactamase superfamily II)
MMTTAVKILSAGLRKVDGGLMFGTVPKTDWVRRVPANRQNRITLGLNCLLLQTCGKTVLVDTGAGMIANDSLGLAPSRLRKNLRSLGVTEKGIDMVILSNLQVDHCGGAIRLDRAGHIVPTFPHARYFVQAAFWEEACHAKIEDFQLLIKRGQLELMDGDKEILPGLQVMIPGGYAHGHQIVRFNHGGERIAFLGDLVPTPYHLNLAVIPAFDRAPQTTVSQKRQVLAQAEREGWLLVFAHGYDTQAGYFQKGKRPSLRAVAL